MVMLIHSHEDQYNRKARYYLRVMLEDLHEWKEGALRWYHSEWPSTYDIYWQRIVSEIIMIHRTAVGINGINL